MSEDYDLPRPVRRNARPYYEALQDMFRTEDIESAAGKMNDRLRTADDKHALWTAIDEHGNTILYNVPMRYKVTAVKAILRHPSGHRLRNVRNDAGDIPLEAPLDHLQTTRITRSIIYGALSGLDSITVSLGADGFTGFKSDAVESLVLLKDDSKIAHIGRLQLKYGCTCASCIGGFLSPRMSFALECQADLAHDSLSMILNTNPDDFRVIFPLLAALSGMAILVLLLMSIDSATRGRIASDFRRALLGRTNASSITQTSGSNGQGHNTNRSTNDTNRQTDGSNFQTWVFRTADLWRKDIQRKREEARIARETRRQQRADWKATDIQPMQMASRSFGHDMV